MKIEKLLTIATIMSSVSIASADVVTEKKVLARTGVRSMAVVRTGTIKAFYQEFIDKRAADLLSGDPSFATVSMYGASSALIYLANPPTNPPSGMSTSSHYLNNDAPIVWASLKDSFPVGAVNKNFLRQEGKRAIAVNGSFNRGYPSIYIYNYPLCSTAYVLKEGRAQCEGGTQDYADVLPLTQADFDFAYAQYPFPDTVFTVKYYYLIYSK